MRESLDPTSPRVMGVLHPLRVVIENYPKDQTEELEAINHPNDESMGTRRLPFSREIYVERDDFEEQPPKKFFRLAPGREVRLRYAYFIRCEEAVKDPSTGEISYLRCTYDPLTKGGQAPDGRKVKGTIHWVSSAHAVKAEVRLYDRLFQDAAPGADGDFKSNLNPDSLEVLDSAQLEPGLADAVPLDRFQFERLGYFCLDSDSSREKLVFNRTVTLRDSWSKR